MKKLGIFLVLILFGSLQFVHASALAEAAKKERARRAALHVDSKKVKVFTNADIENLKSTLAYSYTSGSSDVEETTATEPAAEPQKRQENSEEREALKQEREDLQQKAQEAQATINQGGGYFTRNIGNQYQAIREANQRIHEIDEQLKKSEKGNNESENQEEQKQ